MLHSAAVSNDKQPLVCGQIIDSKEAHTKERTLIVCLFTLSERAAGGMAGGLRRGGGLQGKMFR